MIHSIIPGFVIGILCFAIFRQSKQTRLRYMQQTNSIRRFFDTQAEYIARQTKQLSSVIKAQVELTYAEKYDEIMRELKAIGSILNEFNSQLSTLNSQLSTLDSQLSTLDSQLSTLNSRLVSIEAPVKLWGAAQISNVIKEGESNRTLRRKLQDNREYITSLEQNLQQTSNRLNELKTELEQAKAAARDIVSASMKEISLIRSWMDERGVPCAPLDKHLSEEFKGNIPSQIYSRTKHEQALRDSLREVPLSN